MTPDGNSLFRSPVLAAALAVGCGGSGPDAPTAPTVPTPTPALAAGSDPLLPPPPSRTRTDGR